MDKLEHLVNFRDLRGIPAAEGKRVAPRRLLRAGQPVGLPEKEKLALQAQYQLKNIIDLRSAGEREKDPDDAIPGAAYHVVDILKNLASANTGLESLSAVGSPDLMREYMGRAYAGFVLDPGAVGEFRRFIDILLATPEGASLFHCFAGKDRTGAAAAIILTLLGAAKTDIFADYLRTNEMRTAANAAYFEQARRRGAGEEAVEALSMALTVRPEYLQRSYDEAEKKYGSFEGFISGGIGVTGEETRRLRGMYLV